MGYDYMRTLYSTSVEARNLEPEGTLPVIPVGLYILRSKQFCSLIRGICCSFIKGMFWRKGSALIYSKKVFQTDLVINICCWWLNFLDASASKAMKSNP